MTQTAIPFLFMRGGTSRGPYFNRADLPKDLDTLGEVLMSVLGNGHPLNIDGIGGGNPVTTKVAMLSKSEDDWADIDYFFTQVQVEKREVDMKPTCGNILSGVAAAAIEMGLFTPTSDVSTVKVRAVNTDAKVEAIVQTPGGKTLYEGDTAIAGVPGAHAPVLLKFMEVAGSNVGKMLPTGNTLDTIDGVDVTCLDVGMPMVIARAADFGVTGTETREELDANTALFARIEEVRLKAAVQMGMGDCSASVTPKFGMLMPPQNGGHISGRYFMPWDTHPTMAVTGSQCLSACALMPGTVSDGMMEQLPSGAVMQMEHLRGIIEVVTEYEMDGESFHHISGGLTRTCRLLARGEVYVPSSVWGGHT
ncbi:MAG: PrpF domain-containing protein [Pseudomonadota bacterium]